MVLWLCGLRFKSTLSNFGIQMVQQSRKAAITQAMQTPRQMLVLMHCVRLLSHKSAIEIAASVADQIYQDQPYLFISVGQSVLIWHNTKYESGEDDRERLGGLEYGLDNYHPLLR